MNNEFRLRNVEEGDVADILKIYSPFIKNTAVSFDEKIPTEIQMWQRISGILSNLPYLVCVSESKVVGYAYASNHRVREAYRWSKEVSVYINPGFRKLKIATALYFSLFEILKIQGIYNLLAGITLPNPASISFHEKIGFQKIAEYTNVGYKLEKWHNVGWWEYKLFSTDFVPNKILPWHTIQNSDVVKNILSKGEELIIL